MKLDKEIEMDSLKKMSKDLFNQNQKLKQEIKTLQEQIYNIFTQYRIVVGKSQEKSLNSSNIVNELINGAKNELLIITPIIDKNYLGKLIDKANTNVDVMLVTSEMDQMTSKEYKKTLKTIKSSKTINNFTNPITKSLLIIKDKERALISTGALSEKVLTLTHNIGLLLSNKNDLNTLIRFFKAHLPRFVQVDLIVVEEE